MHRWYAEGAKTGGGGAGLTGRTFKGAISRLLNVTPHRLALVIVGPDAVLRPATGPAFRCQGARDGPGDP